MPLWASISFQNLMTPVSSLLEGLHDLVMVWICVVLIIVSLLKLGTLSSPSASLMLDSEGLEQFWTVLPMLILVTIAAPSFNLLCLQDSFKELPSTSVKIISNQWNWSSECHNETDHLLDVEDTEYLNSLETPVLLPNSTTIRVVITSTDVLHSLGIPSLGLKLDSIPGRLNTTSVSNLSPGLYAGSCYELCGAGHSAMPISMASLS
uniref:Cytochrome c oxidase subunit 2 n=1 Tax=Longidorus vineacola TaxID=241698 RepID=A0A1P8C756_9BILA|nr:cytochrome c oxidase subunit II [Longidorus vineacola]AOT84232.1 cytochrome c oxidase subunit II [Longidorus vineacola]